MTIEVYGMHFSAPCRMVVATLEKLKLPYEFKVVDLMKGENKTPEYLKLNPMHTIPVMKDGDVILTESRAIIAYLADKVGDRKLYPKDDVVAKAKVDQRLFFDMATFYKRLGDTMYPIMFQGTTVPPEKLDMLKEVVGWVEDFVKPTGFVAGTSQLTVADICLAVTYSQLVALGHIDVSGHAKLNEWLAKVKAEIPNVDKCWNEGEQAFAGFYKSKAAEMAK